MNVVGDRQKPIGIYTDINTTYRIPSYKTRGHYFSSMSFIQKSQYIKPKVTVHKCAGIIRTRGYYVLEHGYYSMEEIQYVIELGRNKTEETFSSVGFIHPISKFSFKM